ncbi:MAG: MarR family transcriptional regulator [Desulfurococcales archaeon]|nr:MarR family transcriptional regulator [Desulfurococcales archaeon]
MPRLEETLSNLKLTLEAIAAGPINIQELANKTGLNYNAASRWAEALERLGFITKTLEPGPPRQALLKITQKGECILKCLNQ